MKTIKQFFLLAAICSIAFISCKKECENPCIKSNKEIKLSGKNEVPMIDSKASGVASVVYNRCDQTLSFTIKYKHLTSNPIMAHIHGPAMKGVNAGVKVNLTTLLPESTSGSFEHSVSVDGTILNANDLMAGLYYFNIHTKKFPGGEIRGQIELK